MTALIYLDHAATAFPRHPSVGAAMLEALQLAGNPGRGKHAGARKGGELLARCRASLATLLGVADPERVMIFPSSTAALSTAIQFLVTAGNPERRRFLIGPLEHDAVWMPAVRAAGGDCVVPLPAHPCGRVSPGRLGELASADVAGVILQHAANVNGVVQPIAEVGAWCKVRGLPFIVDGAQAAGLVPVSLEQIPGLVAYTSAGHKYLGGPPGIGIAWFASGFEPEPLWVGGSSVESIDARIPAHGPPRYECGTSNFPGIAGLAAALQQLTPATVAERWPAAREMRERWRQRLAGIAGLEIVGEGPETLERTPNISIRIPGRDPKKLAAELETSVGARCRAGLHCAPLAHRHLGTIDTGTLRIAPGPEVTEAMMERFLGELRSLAARAEGR